MPANERDVVPGEDRQSFPPHSSAGPSPALDGAAAVVTLVGDLAADQGRDDLAGELQRVRAALRVRPVEVLIVGGPGQGKSSVVNALLGAPVCPVGRNRMTAVDTVVGWGPDYTAAAWREPHAGGEASEEPIAYDDAVVLAREDMNPGNAWRIRALAFGVPAPSLARGLTLIDTPAIDHVWHPRSARLMLAMGRAVAVVLVTSAASPLTRGELDLLRVAASACPRVLVVVNGTARYPAWPSVVERNELLLERRGVPATVFAVDAAPYWTTSGGLAPGPDPGMQRLASHLLQTVVPEREQTRISHALTEAFWAADRLRMRLQAERALIADDQAIHAASARLDEACGDAAALCASTAAWRIALENGSAQLRRDLQADLRAEQDRLLAALPEVTSPRTSTAATQRFHGRLADAVAHIQRLRTLALRALARDVAGTFGSDATRLGTLLPLMADAHAVGIPRLDRPVLADRIAMETLPLPATPAVAPDPTPDQWLAVAMRLVADETAQAVDRSVSALEDRCGSRALELHRSLVEVRTAIRVLGAADARAVMRRRRDLAAELDRLATVDWRVDVSP